MNSEQQYLDLYDAHHGLLDAHSAPVLNALRPAARAALQRLGLPSRKVEAYRYTDVPVLLAPDYGLNLNRLQMPAASRETFRCDVPGLGSSLHMMVNDTLLPAEALPEGVDVLSLTEASRCHPEWLAAHYGRLADAESDALTALNTMLAQDGVLVHIAAGVRLERPIQLVNVLRAAVPFMVVRRLLVVVEAGAEATLLLCEHTGDDQDFLSSVVTEVYVGEQARLEMYELEETSLRTHRLAQLYARQAADSTFVLHGTTLTCGTSLSRATVELTAPGASAHLYGAVMTDGRQHVDVGTTLRHLAPDCTSDALYKFALDDDSTGAFAGLVYVDDKAAGTASTETCRALCATPRVRMYSQPMLEIYADDVRCSHGSTVGQTDDTALFYMRQRGISEEEARLLLRFAFVAEVLDAIPLDALRSQLHFLVDKRLRGHLRHCPGCKLPCSNS